jgi:methyltransferase of ATP-grasp peptide maturase system
VTSPTHVDHLRLQLAGELAAKGVLRSPRWRQAFERVPRHTFAPRFYRNRDAAWEVVDSADPAHHDDWLTSIYSDEALITRYEEEPPHLPTSSSSMPSIMAMMLEALDVASGQRVLEIGTGTGYNAALLCERLGDANVTSVDIAPDLIEEARAALTAIGYTPALAVTDGIDGYPENMPYDRVIATCKAWPLPVAWIDQARPGGRIVAPVPGNLAQLNVQPDGMASGRFHPGGVGFMPMRGHAPRKPAWENLLPLVGQEGVTRPRRHPRSIVEGDGTGSAFWSLIQLLVIPSERLFPAGPGEGAIVDLTDHSWVRLELDGDRVTQGGPRRLWDLIERLYDHWCDLGRPRRDRFGLTVTRDGRHRVWLDAPDSEHVWDPAHHIHSR